MTKRYVDLPAASKTLVARGLLWLASEDEPTLLDPTVQSETVANLLLADLFHLDPAWVGREVVRVRVRERACRELAEV